MDRCVLPGTQTLIELRTQFSKSLNTTLLCYLRVFHHQLTADDQRCQVHSVQDVARKIALNLENWDKNKDGTCICGGTGRLFISTGRPARETSINLLKERACLWKRTHQVIFVWPSFFFTSGIPWRCQSDPAASRPTLLAWTLSKKSASYLNWMWVGL